MIKNPPKYKKYIILIILLLVASGLLFFYYSQENLTRLHFDSLEYAQVARNIASGKGICVNSYPLMGLVLLKETNRLDAQKCWPNLNRYLLNAVLLAAYFKIWGARLGVMFSFFITWFFVSIVVFYFLILKIFNQKVALFSTLLFISSYGILNYALFGALELLDISLLCLFFYLIYKPRHHYYYYIAAFIFGLSYLNRYANLFFLPLFLLYIYATLKKQGRLKTLAAFCLIFLVAISPLLIYNFHYTGSPLFSFQTSAMVAARTPFYPNETMTDRRLLIINPLLFILGHPLMMVRKSFLLIREALPLFASEFLGSPLLLSLALLFICFLKSRDRNITWLKYIIPVAFLVNLLSYSLFFIGVRYFTIFVPLIIVFTAGFIADRRFKHQYIMMILILIFNLFPLISYLKTEPKKAEPTYFLSDYLYIQKNTSPSDIILGPDRQIGWFADRKAFSVPSELNDIEIIQKDYLAIKGIYMCAGRFPHPECQDLREETKSISGFYLKEKFESGGLYFERID